MRVVAAILEKGDIIRRYGILYSVMGVNKKRVSFQRASNGFVGGGKFTFNVDIDSKEKIDLVHDCDGLFSELSDFDIEHLTMRHQRLLIIQ